MPSRRRLSRAMCGYLTVLQGILLPFEERSVTPSDVEGEALSLGKSSLIA